MRRSRYAVGDVRRRCKHAQWRYYEMWFHGVDAIRESATDASSRYGMQVIGLQQQWQITAQNHHCQAAFTRSESSAAQHTASFLPQHTPHDRRASGTSPVVHVVKFAYDVRKWLLIKFKVILHLTFTCRWRTWYTRTTLYVCTNRNRITQNCRADIFTYFCTISKYAKVC